MCLPSEKSSSRGPRLSKLIGHVSGFMIIQNNWSGIASYPLSPISMAWSTQESYGLPPATSNAEMHDNKSPLESLWAPQGGKERVGYMSGMLLDCRLILVGRCDACNVRSVGNIGILEIRSVEEQASRSRFLVDSLLVWGQISHCLSGRCRNADTFFLKRQEAVSIFWSPLSIQSSK